MLATIALVCEGYSTPFEVKVTTLLVPSMTICTTSCAAAVRFVRTLKHNNVHNGVWHGRGDILVIGSQVVFSPDGTTDLALSGMRRPPSWRKTTCKVEVPQRICCFGNGRRSFMDISSTRVSADYTLKVYHLKQYCFINSDHATLVWGHLPAIELISSFAARMSGALVLLKTDGYIAKVLHGLISIRI